MRYPGNRGFLVLDILIAGIILASCIAATMYLFRVGYDSLERANRMNVVAEKALHSASMLKSLISERPAGEEDLGEGVTLKWQSRLIGRSVPVRKDVDPPMKSLHEIMLYRVDFTINCRGYEKAYQEDIFRFKPLAGAESGYD